tara:strand:+ start:178 stop:573 length:396 start_codon:yes stop_codon:yes gene_type:complete
MSYHPPKMITNNAAPPIAADLAYEAHGKCGCQTIILSDGDIDYLSWDASIPSGQPELTGCTDYSHVYKIVALSNVKFRGLSVTNIAQQHLDGLIFGNGGFKLMVGSEMLADFTRIEILSGTLMLYRDCDQS